MTEVHQRAGVSTASPVTPLSFLLNSVSYDRVKSFVKWHSECIDFTLWHNFWTWLPRFEDPKSHPGLGFFNPGRFLPPINSGPSLFPRTKEEIQSWASWQLLSLSKLRTLFLYIRHNVYLSPLMFLFPFFSLWNFPFLFFSLHPLVIPKPVEWILMTIYPLLIPYPGLLS